MDTKTILLLLAAGGATFGVLWYIKKRKEKGGSGEDPKKPSLGLSREFEFTTGVQPIGIGLPTQRSRV